MCDEAKSPIPPAELYIGLKDNRCRSQHIAAKEPLRKHPNRSGEGGNAVARVPLWFKNTLPAGFTMISGSP